MVGMRLDTLVAEKRKSDKLLAIMDNDGHPLHAEVNNQRSLFSNRLLLSKCRSNRLQNVPLPSICSTSHWSKLCIDSAIIATTMLCYSCRSSVCIEPLHCHFYHCVSSELLLLYFILIVIFFITYFSYTVDALLLETEFLGGTFLRDKYRSI